VPLGGGGLTRLRQFKYSVSEPVCCVSLRGGDCRPLKELEYICESIGGAGHGLRGEIFLSSFLPN